MRSKLPTWANNDGVNALISMVMDFIDSPFRNGEDEDKRRIMYTQICKKLDELTEEANVEMRAKLENLRKALESVT